MNFREVSRLLAVVAVLLFMSLLAAELSLRVYMFGWAGLSIERVDSFVNIFESDLIQPADNLDVWYELKPDQDTLFRGAAFRTNSRGQADDEYSPDKPPGTYRVAVVGSSWTMGSGVRLEDSFHSVLEREFNAESSSMRYEFINFGVENYGLGEIMGTIRHKVLQYDPDMILLILTGYTPAIRWVPHESAFVPLPRQHFGWSSYVIRDIAGLLGLRSRSAVNNSDLRETVRMNEWGAYFRQIERALAELGQLGDANDIAIAAAWLRLNAERTRVDELFVRRASEQGIKASVIDIDRLLAPGEPEQLLLVNRVEKHPNAYGHQLIAAQLRRIIFDANPAFPKAAN